MFCLPRSYTFEKRLIWLFLVFSCIFLFNFPSIFMFDSSYLDDFHRYTLGLDFKVHTLIEKRNFLRAHFIRPIYWLMSVDLKLARLAQVVLLYIPLSASFFVLYRKFLNLTISQVLRRPFCRASYQVKDTSLGL